MEEDRMTLEEFTELSQGLRQLAVDVPLHWGGVQNNRSDSKINMFDIFTYDEINNGKRTFEYKGCQADVIFILERERNKVEYRFYYT